MVYRHFWNEVPFQHWSILKEHISQRSHRSNKWKEVYRWGKSWVWSHNSRNSVKLFLCPSLAGRLWRPELWLVPGGSACAALTEVAADELLHSSSQLEAINTSCSSFFILPWKKFPKPQLHCLQASPPQQQRNRWHCALRSDEVCFGITGKSQQSFLSKEIPISSQWDAAQRELKTWAKTENGTPSMDTQSWHTGPLPADCRVVALWPKARQLPPSTEIWHTGHVHSFHLCKAWHSQGWRLVLFF